MFFDRFERLCKEKGVSMNKAIVECGFSNSLPTKWKKTGATPEITTISALASYFNKSVEYMSGMTLDAQIDDTQYEIAAIKKKMEHETDQQALYDYDVDLSELKDALSVLLSRLKSEQKNKPVGMTNEQLKFALFGETDVIDDADLEDVKRYADFVRERKEQKNGAV